MPRKINSNICSQCNQSVGNENSICCTTCNICHHLECSRLGNKEFLGHKNKWSLRWVCKTCSMYRCGKCIKVIRKKECILCNSCEQWFHRKCSLLAKKDFDKIDNSEKPWFCWSCRKDNIPFQALSPLQMQKLFVFPKSVKIKMMKKSVEIKFARKEIITLKMA